MRCLSPDEIEEVSGGDWQEVCRYTVMGGGVVAIAAIGFWAVAALLPATSIAAGTTVMMGSAGYVTMSSTAVAQSTATMVAMASAAGVRTAAASGAIEAVGAICSGYYM